MAAHAVCVYSNKSRTMGHHIDHEQVFGDTIAYTCSCGNTYYGYFNMLDHLKETEHRNVQKPYIREACGE